MNTKRLIFLILFFISIIFCNYSFAESKANVYLTSNKSILQKGEELEIIKLDTYQGNVSIKGKVDSITYSEDGKKDKEGGIFNKLFK